MSDVTETLSAESDVTTLLKFKTLRARKKYSIWLNTRVLNEHLCHLVAPTWWHSGLKYLHFNVRIANRKDPLYDI
jgi:hypothetical protein